jgi:hypothetical protein
VRTESQDSGASVPGADELISRLRRSADDLRQELFSRRRSCVRALGCVEAGAAKDAAALREDLRGSTPSIAENLGISRLVLLQQRVGSALRGMRGLPSRVRAETPEAFWTRPLVRRDRARRFGCRLRLQSAHQSPRHAASPKHGEPGGP